MSLPYDTMSLDHRIWSKLPDDTIYNIIDHLDKRSQKDWACVSHKFHDFARARIWQSLSVEGKNFDAYFSLNEQEKSSAPTRNTGIIHFLVHNPLRPDANPTFGELCTEEASEDIPSLQHLQKSVKIPRLDSPLPGWYVSNLSINTLNFDCRQDALDSTLPLLLKCVPRLARLAFDGVLRSTTLDAIVQVESLRSLIIRQKSVRQLLSHMAKFPSNVPRWLFEPLELNMLGLIRNLRYLDIGRFKVEESRGLIQALSMLKLEVFYLRCFESHSQRTHTKFSNKYKNHTHESPLVLLLQEICKPKVQAGGISSGFPRSLKTLLLRDSLHSRVPSLFGLIANAIQSCSQRSKLKIDLLVSITAAQRLEAIGVCSWPQAMGMRSVEELLSDGFLKTSFAYKNPMGKWLSTVPLPEPGAFPLNGIAKTIDGVLAQQENVKDADWIRFSLAIEFYSRVKKDELWIGSMRKMTCKEEKISREVTEIIDGLGAMKIA